MAKMTENGALPGKQILDFIKEPVLQRGIFIIDSPNPPHPPEWSPTDTWQHTNTYGFNNVCNTYFTSKIISLFSISLQHERQINDNLPTV